MMWWCLAVAVVMTPTAVNARDIVGAVNLDQYTLDKVVATHTTLVRFDRMHAYGAKEEVFKDLALKLAELGTPSDFVLGYVGVQEFQEKLSLDMAEKRFGVYKKDWPVYKLFLKGQADNPITYTGEVDVDALLVFLKERAGLRFALRGCLPAFDDLAREFMESTGETRRAVLDRATAAQATVGPKDEANAGWYTKAMAKILETGEEYAETELARIRKLVDGTALSDAKKEQFKQRANILASFQAPPDIPSHEEL